MALRTQPLEEILKGAGSPARGRQVHKQKMWVVVGGVACPHPQSRTAGRPREDAEQRRL